MWRKRATNSGPAPLWDSKTAPAPERKKPPDPSPSTHKLMHRHSASACGDETSPRQPPGRRRYITRSRERPLPLPYEYWVGRSMRSEVWERPSFCEEWNPSQSDEGQSPRRIRPIPKARFACHRPTAPEASYIRGPRTLRAVPVPAAEWNQSQSHPQCLVAGAEWESCSIRRRNRKFRARADSHAGATDSARRPPRGRQEPGQYQR